MPAQLGVIFPTKVDLPRYRGQPPIILMLALALGVVYHATFGAQSALFVAICLQARRVSS